MVRISSLAMVILALLGCGTVSQAQAQYTKTYANFYSALAATLDVKYCRSIVDSLGLKASLSNPNLQLTVFTPQDKAFISLASRLKTTPEALSKNKGLMKQILFYHFVTGSDGAKKVLSTAALKPGMQLDTMLVSPTNKKHYQLSVAASNTAPSKLAIKSVGTTANIVAPNQKCGLGVAHGVDNVLIPVKL